MYPKARIKSRILIVYAIRLAIGEPPFANIRSALRLDRFTLRGKRKVNVQWNLICIVHNMKKIQRYGPGFHNHQKKWQDAARIIGNPSKGCKVMVG